MHTKILGISGKKQSGKNTSTNYVLGIFMQRLGLTDSFEINQEGELYISDLFGDKVFSGIFDIENQSDDFIKFRKENLDHFIKVYSLASPLKQICIDIFGLDYSQCYGTDEEKNTLTKFKWEDMPVETTSTGYLTAREVLQLIGTDMFRAISGNIWFDATKRAIQKDRPALAIIADIRFPNEANGTKQAGGKIIRLARSPYNDGHISETALSMDNYDWKLFDHIVENANMTIKAQNDEVHKYLEGINYLPKDVRTY